MNKQSLKKRIELLETFLKDLEEAGLQNSPVYVQASLRLENLKAQSRHPSRNQREKEDDNG